MPDGPLSPVAILIRCTLCPSIADGAFPFEAALGPAGRSAFDRHLKTAHGLTFDPPTLDAWLDRVRRG